MSDAQHISPFEVRYPTHMRGLVNCSALEPRLLQARTCPDSVGTDSLDTISLSPNYVTGEYNHRHL